MIGFVLDAKMQNTANVFRGIASVLCRIVKGQEIKIH